MPGRFSSTTGYLQADAAAKSLQIPVRQIRAMPGVARWKCVRRCHLSVYLSRLLSCSGYGAAALRRRSKSLRVVRNGGKQHQIGTSRRPACALAALTVKSVVWVSRWGVTMPPPVVVPVKIRHINPRQMIGITEQRVTVKNPMF